ncbi:MAG: hypothetical protein JGK26_22190 [Microcoleus sp. PH2017_27_LUM_O_A]|nr:MULTISPECIES: hypothetical protein [unclassified Microcoleus]MCC3478987.1 hypothetical protein [Microcoleus sp. PH2017_12_PCY_D_A]MCC3561795.1 hypothetical protein [Microcoleus sp. PH2017_27_LUM_O_A]
MGFLISQQSSVSSQQSAVSSQMISGQLTIILVDTVLTGQDIIYEIW